MEDIFFYFACKYFGDWERIYDAIEEQKDVDFEQLAKWKEEYKGRYVTVLSPEYPDVLKHIQKPPFVLFYKGNKELFKNKTKIWYFGSYFNEKFLSTAIKQKIELDECGVTLVTGFSNDFEKKLVTNISMKGSIIVKDSGIDSNINMSKIEENALAIDNLIISEYPDKVIPSLYTWTCSNRIKHGLSNGMFLINTLKEKLMFKMISAAIDDKIRIFCYDKDIDKESHNSVLISKGAYAINRIKETTKRYG